MAAGQRNRLLAMMDAPSVRKRPTAPFTLKPMKWRESHHWLAMSVARAQALGHPVLAVASGCGYSRQQLKQLLEKEHFKDLVKHYGKLLTPNDVRPPLVERDLMNANFMKGLRLQGDWMEEVSDQCERGGPYPAKLIHDHLQFLADRLGYGPEQTNVNVGVTGYAEGLAKARKEEILKLGPRQPRAIETATEGRTEEIQARAEPNTVEEIKPVPEAPIDSGGLSGEQIKFFTGEVRGRPVNGGGHAT